MKDVKGVIASISGKIGKKGYYDLSFAVYIAMQYQPMEVPLKVIFAQMRQMKYTTNEINSVNRAIARAVDDIWKNGSRENLCKIFGRELKEKPSTRDMICALSQYCWAMKEE